MSVATVVSSAEGARPAGWEATLELGFEHVAGATKLVRRRHRGPLRV